jgi:hypothetical protein
MKQVGTVGSNHRRQNAANRVTNFVCTEIGELALENDFLSGALGKAGLCAETNHRPRGCTSPR